MTAADLTPDAIEQRAKIRERTFAADRMLKRAEHMEKRAARAKFGSNEREKLTRQASELRMMAADLNREISQIMAEKLLQTGSRQETRAR